MPRERYRRSPLPALVAMTLAVVAGCPSGPRPAPPAAPTAPAEVVAAAKATLETWRQAYEVRSAESLGRLYHHGRELVVVRDGHATTGWDSVEPYLAELMSKSDSIHVELKNIQVIPVGLDVAIVVADIYREYVTGPQTVSRHGALSLVLRRDGGDGSWRIALEDFSSRIDG